MKLSWSKKDIVDYYHANEFAYKLWGRNMHYGYWEKDTKTQQQASLRFNEKMAQRAAIGRDDYVLDAGCGVGGASIYLAKTFGCRAVGVTITPRQVGLARANAARENVAHLTEFHEMDYTHTTFPDATFTVVWGLESICYADDKAAFLREVYRLLKPGGRFIMADGFASRTEYQGADRKLMDKWLDGWIVNNVETPGNWKKFAAAAGFTNVWYENVTAKVKPTSRLMYFVSWPFMPLHQLNKFIPLGPYPTDALYHQYHAMNRGLWEYGMFYAEKR